MSGIPREKNERATFVAALRELATLIESDESLPVPFHTRLQAGFFGTWDEAGNTYVPFTTGEQRAQLRAFADRLGVDVVEGADGGRTAELRIGVLTYLAHVNPDARDARPDGKRVVPAAEDAQLTGATA